MAHGTRVRGRMTLFIPGPEGRLEALLWPAQGPDREPTPPRAAAIVCHPHPLGGGTMHNNVVFRIARGLQQAGVVTLRFNFRGVESSAGEHDGNGAEEGDARAALDWLAAEHPGLPLWAAGFSFGARTLAHLTPHEARIERLICVAPPARIYDLSVLLQVERPTYCLMAEGDEYGNLSDLEARLGALPANFETDEIPGVDHFFRGATPKVEARIRDYAHRNLETPA